MTEIRACEGTDLRRALCCRHRIFKDLSAGFAQCERDATGAASVPPRTSAADRSCVLRFSRLALYLYVNDYPVREIGL